MDASYSERERMLAGLSATSQVLDVAGVATQAWEAGDGPAMPLLHGVIECGAAMWAPVVRRLAARNRVVVPDVAGMGESAPVPRLDVETFSGWLFDLLRRLQLRQPSVYR